jgi:hypothetical protein
METTTGTPVETGGKAPYFFSKTTGKLHFCAVFIIRCCPKTAVLGKGWVWFRLELYWSGDSWVGKNSPGFFWSSIGVRIGSPLHSLPSWYILHVQ